MARNTRMSFNSLQAGKPIQTKFGLTERRASHIVSIPFKRESLFKHDAAKHRAERAKEGFNSLQAGKPIQTKSCKIMVVSVTLKFQFPSSGKAYSNLLLMMLQILLQLFQFPSSGKAYSNGIKLHRGLATTCFNSLQAGKPIQTQDVDDAL